MATQMQASSTMSTMTPAPAPAKPKQRRIRKSAWSYTVPDCIESLQLPAGQYYIGDLCYALDDLVYDKIFGEVGKYQSGFYRKSDKEFFYLDGTSVGDGEYMGSDGKTYSVDAGIIGITPIACMKQSGDGGHVHTFTSPVRVRFKDGLFTFSSAEKELEIQT